MAGPFCLCGCAKAGHRPRCAFCADCAEFTEVQPHFAAYAMAHGTSPKAMLAHDAQRFPGGKMAGFIAWISLRSAEFSVRHPECVRADGAILDHEKWGRFLWTEGQKASVAL